MAWREVGLKDLGNVILDAVEVAKEELRGP